MGWATGGVGRRGTTWARRLAAGTVLVLVGVLPVLGTSSPAIAADCVVTAAGDIAGSGDPQHHEYVNALRTGDVVRAVAPTHALTLGDNAYDGSPQDFAAMYDPTWGSFKAITKPSPGNHEYFGDDAVGYFGYFFAGQRAGNEYYATTCGSWRLYSLNCEIDCGTGSAQLAWLQQDLAAHPGLHYLGYLHQPRFSSGSSHGSNSDVSAVWAALQQAGGDVMLSAHDHNYERFAKRDSTGAADPNGMRQFVVGTGGAGLTGFGSPEPGSEVRDATHYGVLKLVLGDESYRWEFLSAGRHESGGDDVDDPDHPIGTVLDSGATATNTTLGGNRAPVVDAGADGSVVLPGSVALDGTVSDDGLPVGSSVSQTWSQVSGPGSVVFGDASAQDTSASFSGAGTYVLRLTATDGELSGSDEVTVTVTESGGGGGGSGTVLERLVVAGADDAEQSVGSGSVEVSSSDLELVTDGSTVQVVGLRFRDVQVPAGSVVTSAWVQFRTDEVSTGAVSLTVRAEAADNAAAYTSTANSIGSRATTSASVAWSPPGWDLVGEAGADQRTPNLASLVQAVVDRAGWSAGNAVAFQVAGSGRRTADAYEGGAAGAALLHLEYTAGGGGGPVNAAPVVDAGADGSVVLPGSVALDGTVSDDGLPVGSSVSQTWSQVSGPGSVVFGDASAQDTSASFSGAGTYVLRLTATDGELSGSDEVTVTVTDGTPVNAAPVVDAGADLSVTLPGSASLNGSVSDDGLPAGSSVSQTWSVDSGPGAVAFGDASAQDTSASFSAAGTYVLRLTATDGELTGSDTSTVTVTGGGGGGSGTVVERRVSAGTDDAEQSLNGSMDVGSSDLELVTDGRRVQVTATRFRNVTVPQGAAVTGAWIQFTTHQTTSTPTSLTIRTEDADNPPTYTRTRGDITDRAVTAADVAWSPTAWTVVGAAGTAQRTPDLTSLVQAVVNRAGWASGNAMAFQFSGTGVRTAVSHDSDAASAPQLHIEYAMP